MIRLGRPLVYHPSRCLRQLRPPTTPQHLLRPRVGGGSSDNVTLLIPSLILRFASAGMHFAPPPKPKPAILTAAAAAPPPPPPPTPSTRRSFFNGLTGPSSAPESFSATRQLPHPPSKVFAVVSDVDSYSAFLPYCISSKVTQRTPPPESLPTSADLRVGFAGVDETFTSKVRCSTDAARVLEADASENGIFEVLKARWTVSDGSSSGSKGAGTVAAVGKSGSGSSDVKLDIEYKFSNPFYAAVSQAVMPKVAGILIEAFERRTNEVLKPKA